MPTLRRIREKLDYTHVLRLGRFGHMYIPQSLGAVRASVKPEAGGVTITLTPTRGPYIVRLFTLPREYWPRVFDKRTEQMTVFFRPRGTQLVGFVPYRKEDDE
jgi:hypothetical protein